MTWRWEHRRFVQVAYPELRARAAAAGEVPSLRSDFKQLRTAVEALGGGPDGWQSEGTVARLLGEIGWPPHEIERAPLAEVVNALEAAPRATPKRLTVSAVDPGDLRRLAEVLGLRMGATPAAAPPEPTGIAERAHERRRERPRPSWDEIRQEAEGLHGRDTIPGGGDTAKFARWCRARWKKLGLSPRP
jgi:hypothetical protein